MALDVAPRIETLPPAPNPAEAPIRRRQPKDRLSQETLDRLQQLPENQREGMEGMLAFAPKITKHTRETIPVSANPQEKTETLNKGKEAVKLKLRQGEQLDARTGERQLVFGVNPLDPSDIIIAPDNRIVRREKKGEPGWEKDEWEYDSNVIQSPIVVTEYPDGRIRVDRPDRHPDIISKKQMRQEGKPIYYLSDEASLGIADFDPEQHELTVFKRATDMRPPEWFADDINSQYEAYQQRLAREAEEKAAQQGNGVVDRLKTNDARRVSQMRTEADYVRREFVANLKKNPKLTALIGGTMLLADQMRPYVPPQPLADNPAIEAPAPANRPQASDFSVGEPTPKPNATPEPKLPDDTLPTSPPKEPVKPAPQDEGLKGKMGPMVEYEYSNRPDLLDPNSEKYISIKGLVEAQLAEAANTSLSEQAEQLRKVGKHLPEDDPRLLETLEKMRAIINKGVAPDAQPSDKSLYDKVVDLFTESMEAAIKTSNPEGTIDPKNPDRVTVPRFKGMIIDAGSITATAEVLAKGVSSNYAPFKVDLEKPAP